MTERLLCQLAVSFLLGVVMAWTKQGWLLPVTVLFWLYICIRLIQYVNIPGKRRTGSMILFLLFRMLLCLILFLAGIFRCGTQLSISGELDALLENGEQVFQGSEVHVSGQIYKKEEKGQQVIYYLKNAYLKGQTKDYLCNNILVYHDTDTYFIGNTIYIKGNLGAFREATNVGNFDEKSFYQSKNIFLAVSSKEIQILDAAKDAFQEKLYVLKKNILSVYEELLPEKEAGILAVMSIGDKELLDTEIKRVYQRSGISHVLAISGLHVSLLGSGIYHFLRKIRLPLVLACFASIFFVYSFGVLSGMEISTGRAVIMFLLSMMANGTGKAYDSLTALGLSMLVQLWENPLAASYAGFLFSYAAVLGIVIAARVIKDFWKKETDGRNKKGSAAKLKQNAGQTIFMSFCIQLTTLPLTLYFYYEFPVYSIIINGILLPFMGLLLFCGLAGGILGLAGKMVGWIVLRPCQWMLNWNELVCKFFEGLPGSICITGKPDIRLLMAYYGILAGTLFLMKLLMKKECGYVVKGMASAIPIMALICVVFLRPAPEFELAMLDVGQGDGIYIQSEEGMHFFIDGGSSNVPRVGEYRILPFLKCKGISAIDGWFISHGDADHVSGLIELWELGYTIHYLILAEGMVKDEAWEELTEMALKYGTKIIYLSLGGKAGTKSLVFTCIYPGDKILRADRNGASMVLKMEMGGFSALFTGDIGIAQEREILEKGGIGTYNFYKAAHHGSATSNASEFLQALKPGLTVISCAEKNSYGHPAPEAVERIKESGSRIFYTMESGQVTVKWEDGKVYVQEFKK